MRRKQRLAAGDPKAAKNPKTANQTTSMIGVSEPANAR
jgi:hypothetical protein